MKLEDIKVESQTCSRRNLLKTTAAMAAGGLFGSALTACSDKPDVTPVAS